MKRCILISTRTNTDKETKDELLFLTLAKLPSKMNNGGLWHPKANELLSTVCINKTRKPDDFKKFSEMFPGTLIDITMGVNEFTGKLFVAAYEAVEDTVNIIDESILYV